MRHRPTPRPTPPDEGNYLRIEVDGRGTTYWRLPFPVLLARLQQRILASDLERIARADTGDSAQVDAVLDDAVDLWCVAGAAVGLCWHDLDSDLDSDRHAHPDLMQYGEAVLEELHDAGWTAQQIGQVYPRLLAAVVRVMPPASEVAGRMGFSEARRGAATS